MSCKVCPCVVGKSYSLVNAICMGCGDTFEKVGTYIGLIENVHRFRLHPRIMCPNCSIEQSYSDIPCEDFGGWEVTKEFNVMFHRKDSHWIGGSNAER